MIGRARRGELVAIRPEAPAIDDLSDAALVAASATGDRAARAALFARHVDAVHRFVARMAASDDDVVDDLVQATFLAAFSAAAGFRAEAAVRSWLCGIAANLVRNHARGEIRRKAMLTGVGQLPVRTVDVEDRVVRAQLVARLPAALATLPHDLRAVLVLVDLEETKGADAAAALGIPEGTLWRRLHHARTALRAALDGGAS